jgi:predicted histidine transporter YuiF (NhaC family)
MKDSRHGTSTEGKSRSRYAPISFGVIGAIIGIIIGGITQIQQPNGFEIAMMFSGIGFVCGLLTALVITMAILDKKDRRKRQDLQSNKPNSTEVNHG